jgi:hypothetical protein
LPWARVVLVNGVGRNIPEQKEKVSTGFERFRKVSKGGSISRFKRKYERRKYQGGMESGGKEPRASLFN